MQRLGGHEDSTSMALLSHKGAFSSRCIWPRHGQKASRNKDHRVSRLKQRKIHLRGGGKRRVDALLRVLSPSFEVPRRPGTSTMPEIKTPPSMEPSNQVMCAIARSGSTTNPNQARSFTAFCCSGWLATLAPAPRIMWSRPRSASSRPLLVSLRVMRRENFLGKKTPKRRRREEAG